VPVQIDGEVLGELPLEISIHPKRLKLIFPVRQRASQFVPPSSFKLFRSPFAIKGVA
jgi:hypothetical protein